MFKEISSKGLTPDVVTYTTLIGGLCKVGRIQDAQELILEMQIRGQVLNCRTYATLLHGLCENGQLEEAMKLFQDI